MAKFLATRKISSEIEDLIKGAENTLYLISPYLKLSNDFKELLKLRNDNKKFTTIIFGKQELNPEEMKFLQSLRLVYLKYYQTLHAKCYLNDDRMIITSMNFYEYSMQHNKEMGILIDRSDPADEKIYTEALSEIKLIENSNSCKDFDFTPIVEKPLSKERTPSTFYSKKQSTVTSKKQPTNYNKKQSGFCIRCKAPLNLNPMVPFCRDCFSSWKKFGNEEYQEKYCHICGESNKTSKLKPSCYTCYKKNSKVLDFPI